MSRVIVIKRISGETQYLYPNPADERVFLNPAGEEVSKVMISKPDGQVLLMQLHVNDGISVKSLPVGIYLWSSESIDGSVSSGKIVIAR